jgi:hypothetical protein
MNNTICSRSLSTSLENWMSHERASPERTWYSIFQRLQRTTSSGVMRYEYTGGSGPNRTVFTFSEEEAARINQVASTMDNLVGNAKALAFVLWLEVSNRKQEFLNNFKGAVNAI